MTGAKPPIYYIIIINKIYARKQKTNPRTKKLHSNHKNEPPNREHIFTHM